MILVGPKLDVLINNAAFIKFSDIRQIEVEEISRILNVNLRAPFILSKLALSKFEVAGAGAIINISSTRSLMSESCNEAYCASKGRERYQMGKNC